MMPQQQPILPAFGEPRLDALQRHAFAYFLHHTNPVNGLVVTPLVRTQSLALPQWASHWLRMRWAWSAAG